MTRSENELTVILPCAGSGSRLGLDSPKELYEIVPGVRLIDFSIRHIRSFIRSFDDTGTSPSLKVVVVSRPWKQAVPEYVQTQLPELEVRAIHFNDSFYDWPGSVYSAAAEYSPGNIVLLPDSFLAVSGDDPFHQSPGNPLITCLTRELKHNDLVFGAVPCLDFDRLKKLGALFVESRTVTRFCDKPDADFHLYNSFWGCYAFSRDIGLPLYQFMLASVQQRPLPTTHASFFPAAAIPIADYYDLGTWPSITSFRTEWSSLNKRVK